MNFTKLVLGDLRTNCYILEKNNKVIVIDPAAELDKILEVIKDKELEGILVTHHHYDHILALNDLEDKYNIYANDYNNIKTFNIEVIKTPGHSPDCKTFYFKDEAKMFTGDFLFMNTIGRTDFPGGNSSDMKKSLGKIKEYDDNIDIYPGHGKSSNLKNEKENIPNYQL